MQKHVFYFWVFNIPPRVARSSGQSVRIDFVRDAFLFYPSKRTWIQIFGMVGGHPKKLAANSEILDKRGGGSNFSSFTRALTSTPRPRRNPRRRPLPRCRSPPAPPPQPVTSGQLAHARKHARIRDQWGIISTTFDPY